MKLLPIMNQARALLSVHHKEGLRDLAGALSAAGYELIASGGTAAFLKSCGHQVTPVESITGNPEAFQGRMKTISFQIESAILFDRDNPTHRQEAEALGIVPIDVVVCNFYPIERALRERLPLDESVELIDIGGPAMVRAAAKNFKHVLVLVDPADYAGVAGLLGDRRKIPHDERLRLASKAFKITARYDAQIDRYYHGQMEKKIRWFRFQDGEALRYGENPHQRGFAFRSEKSDPLSLFNFEKVGGKELSYNNYLDADAAVAVLSRLGGEKPACVIVKHGNPCGAAVRDSIQEAFEKAWEGDPLAAFGGVAAFNRPISLLIADRFLSEKRFAEIFLAPEIEDLALERLTDKKKNLRILLNDVLASPFPAEEWDMRRIRGGVLIQEPDRWTPGESDLEVVSKRRPTEKEWRDLLFAWKIGRESKSNSIVLAKDDQLVGSGVGQQDRLRACRLAVEKAGWLGKGASAASDAFFPFPDGPELLIKAGVTAIIHPGGSIRDAETIQLCDKHGAALVTTRGMRGFKH